MASRLTLQAELQSIIGVRSDGKANVYFQPPESIKLHYPCIIYKKVPAYTMHADNKIYRFTPHYEITTITEDPDSTLSKIILTHFEHCSSNKSFISDNLYHDVLDLYY